MNYEEDQVTDAEYKDVYRRYPQHFVTSNVNPVEFHHSPTWSSFPEKEKWKLTVGVMLRSLAISVIIWVVVFLAIAI